MKKITFWLAIFMPAIIGIAVVFSAPAQAAVGQQTSLYAATDNSTVGLPLPYKHMELFDSTMFDTASTGIFILDGDMFKANNYAGLTKITGACYQSENTWVRIYLNTATGMFRVAEGGEKFLRFEFVTASPWMQLGAVQYVMNPNLLKCALLFEAVE
jgi:hypothetical protein